MPGIPGDQKEASDPLELDFRVVVMHYVGSGNQSWALYKRGKCSQLLSPSAAFIAQPRLTCRWVTPHTVGCTLSNQVAIKEMPHR